jgi:hypothetical protein
MDDYCFQDIAADDGAAMEIFCGVGDAENSRGLDPIEAAEWGGEIYPHPASSFEDEDFAAALDFLVWLERDAH